MAVRITVVIVQAAERHGRLSDYEEQLLTRVMLENSLDAVFVGAFEQMTPDGTDALCLSKIPANSIVLGWLPATEAAVHVERLGLPWLIRQPQVSTNTPSTAVQYRQIRMEQPMDELMSSLLQVLKNSSIKTLQISMPISGSRTAKSEPVLLASQVDPHYQAPHQAQHQQLPPNSGPRMVEPMRPFAPTARAEVSQRDELDQLVDDLEALDL